MYEDTLVWHTGFGFEVLDMGCDGIKSVSFFFFLKVESFACMQL